LQRSLNTNNFDKVDETLQHILDNTIDIDVKLLDRGSVDHERLRTEGIISRFLESVAYVEDYKTIQKSVNSITEMLEDAVKRGVQVDPLII